MFLLFFILNIADSEKTGVCFESSFWYSVIILIPLIKLILVMLFKKIGKFLTNWDYLS